MALLISSFIVGGSPPDAGDSTREVVAFWREHQDAQIASALLAGLAAIFFLLLDGGVLVAVFATAAVTLQHGGLPRWFGYLSMAVGVIFLTPAFAVAFPAFGVWMVALSLLILRAGFPGR
jgi:hypothetical protein